MTVTEAHRLGLRRQRRAVGRDSELAVCCVARNTVASIWNPIPMDMIWQNGTYTYVHGTSMYVQGHAWTYCMSLIYMECHGRACTYMFVQLPTGLLAQLAELRVWYHKVLGSNPTFSTKHITLPFSCCWRFEKKLRICMYSFLYTTIF